MQIWSETLEEREDQVLQLNHRRGLWLCLFGVLFGCLFVDRKTKNRILSALSSYINSSVLTVCRVVQWCSECVDTTVLRSTKVTRVNEDVDTHYYMVTYTRVLRRKVRKESLQQHVAGFPLVHVEEGLQQS